MAADFGDAPDIGLGAAQGNYHTLLSDNGPRHTIVAGLRMGASVDGYDGGVLQNAGANADDINGALPDDEDGLANPTADLSLTVGTTPTVNVWVTNTTGASATLYGWIDYNADGVFDNATEQGSVAVPAGTSSKIVTVSFPTVPSGFTGTTYARFRLSTDEAAANSTGAAADGEVEDYRAEITELSSGIVASSRSTKIGAGGAGEPSLPHGAWFGGAVALLGDLDGDGVVDVAVSSLNVDGVHGIARGEIFVMFLNSDGSVKSNTRITDSLNGGPALPESNYFGNGIAAIGDLDGNGVSEIVVGDDLDSTGGPNRGAVYVLFMNADGTVQSSQKIATGMANAPPIADFARFGCSVAALGDFNGDGVNDMVVGASGNSTGGSARGAAYVLMMNADGTVKNSQKIASGMNGGPPLANGDRFGSSLCTLGDVDGDGISDIVVGASLDDTGNSDAGAVYVLFMNVDGTAKSWRKIANGSGLLQLNRRDYFGASVAALNDVDGDGVADIAVGAFGDNTGFTGFSNYVNRGAVHVLFLNADGTVKGQQIIANRTGGGPLLGNDDDFGYSVTSLGDLDGDGVIDLAVGAPSAESAGHGIVHLLPLQQDNDFAPQFMSSATVNIAENTTTVLTVTATDADLPAQPLSFSIVGGVDRGVFEITSGGALSFRWPRDFEVPNDANRDNVYEVIVEVSDNNSGTAVQTISVSISDVADPPSVDFGDAPDSVAGTGSHDYQTTAADNGPRHTIVAGLRLGAYVDGDNGTFVSATANADDLNGALPDDEDRLSNPLADLTLTVGAQPTVNVWVTNTTGAAGTLYGWIDYNADGVFDNDSERASEMVPNGSASSNVTLVFPAVPNRYTGVTYARFRLSTDVAAANPTGSATDGEVEDYRATIIGQATGRADRTKNKRISNNLNGGPALTEGDRFGRSVAAIGDLDGDGVVDLAVGADQYDSSYSNGGAVYVLFMKPDGTVKSSTKIASEIGGGPPVTGSDTFGIALASIGDLDGDGHPDIVVANSVDSLNGRACGAIYVLFLNADGTAKRTQRIGNDVGGGPTLNEYDQFGHAVTAVGDLDGDGVNDLAVGAPGDTDGQGALYVLFMNADGTAKSSQIIADETGGGPDLAREELFGYSVAGLGDFDGDGVNDIVVGATGDDGSDTYLGAAYVVLLHADGTAKSWQRISADEGGGPPLAEYGNFGSAVASLGDLDGDGVTDIGVGASDERAGGPDRGAIYVLYLNADGTAKSRWKIADNTNGGPSLADYDKFGRGLTSLGDLDGDGITDIAVGEIGSTYDDYADPDRFGSVHVLFLKPVTPDFGDAPDTGPGNAHGNYSTTATDNGPSHVIVDGLRLGGSVDGDAGLLQNAAANADSPDGQLPSDEDGLVNAAADLQLTSGTAPTISLWVTNTTGAAATLYGWIDYNADGVLDIATERASVAVPNGSNPALFTLTFPVVPSGVIGPTYARFRLSTDAAAANSIGPAADGEVEDYRVQIYAPTSGTPDGAKTAKITTLGAGPMASLGDLDGDGVNDMIVWGDQLVFMNSNGTVKRTQEIDDLHVPYGDSITPLGDLDGDGVTDFAMGSDYPEAVSVVLMNADGTVKSSQMIAGYYGIGSSVAAVGDLNGDGTTDLAVGQIDEDDDQYHVFLLQLNANGSVKDVAVIGNGIGGGPPVSPSEYFGASVASLGDVDGDGFTDIAVGAPGDGQVDSSGYMSARGAVYILFLNADGEAKGYQKIADGVGGGPTLHDEDLFGGSLAALGDLDGDGITDLAVGARYDDTGGDVRGAIYILYLIADGTAKHVEKIAHNTGGGPTLQNYDVFGYSMTSMGDLNGDGLADLAVSAHGDDTAGYGEGAIYVLFSTPAVSLPGDYNFDNVVDSADYVLWRKTLNSEVPKSSGADGNGNGIVDNDDYGIWRANSGRSLPASTPPSSNSSIVPTSNSSISVINVVQEVALATAQQPHLTSDVMPARLSTVFAPAIGNEPKVSGAPTRSRRHNVATSIAVKNDALLTWLSTMSERPVRKPNVSDFDDLPAEAAALELPSRVTDAVELAFASLAQGSLLRAE